MPMIIVGGNLLERSDSEVYFYYLNIKFKALLSEIKKISLNSKILKVFVTPQKRVLLKQNN